MEMRACSFASVVEGMSLKMHGAIGRGAWRQGNDDADDRALEAPFHVAILKFQAVLEKLWITLRSLWQLFAVIAKGPCDQNLVGWCGQHHAPLAGVCGAAETVLLTTTWQLRVMHAHAHARPRL